MTENLTQPVALNERLNNIDVIRGVAILGILLMNIQVFSMIFSAYSNPNSFGDLSGNNFIVYYLSHIFADQKFMTIFSVLFGVGIVLMADNIERKGGSPGRIHYKRMCILALFGMLHAYLLWFGDILFPYALAGMIAYTARKKSPKFLFITAFVLLALYSLIMILGGLSLPYWEAEELQLMQAMWTPTNELITKDNLANLGSWIDQSEQRNFMASKTQSNILFYLPRIIGLMMIGMALFKLDFFGKRYENKTLMLTGLIAFIISLALIIYGNKQNFAGGWSLDSMFTGAQFNYWGSILMAYSYLCFLIMFCRTNVLSALKQVLANVGRMALTNYLSQSFICGFIFYGWGLGLYGSFERLEQLFVVFAVWSFQLVFSTLWMSRFQFGPVEWLWRTMTYSKVQSIKIKPEVLT